MVQISYLHIKTCLAMRNSGVSLESIQSGGNQSEKNEDVNDASNLSEPPLETCNMEVNEVVPSGPVNGCQVQNHPLACEEEFASKRQKVSETEGVNSIKLEATESSVVEWLTKLDEGVSEDLFIFLIQSFMIYVYILVFVVFIVRCVAYLLQASLSDILKHFNGSNEDAVVELLNCLESDFSIYRKSNMYRAM